MEGSGLNKLIFCAFAGVEKMLTDKKFPMNVRALRQVALELLKEYIDDKITSYSEFHTSLEDVSNRNVLALGEESYTACSPDDVIHKSWTYWRILITLVCV